MVASFSVIKSSGYYTRESSAVAYYAAEESAGIWLRGHEGLGVSAEEAVRAEDFDRICAGLNSTGELLAKGPAKGQRMLGVDVTLSSPKSVSILWAMADAQLRRTIGEAERQAVEAALNLIEQEIPLARRGHGGVKREHARFVAAVFTHSEARPEQHADGTIMPSPQRHHHVCIPSICERPDGSWGAIDSMALRTWKKALGAIYRLQLATALQERGFTIEQADDDWRWSIAGVPDSVCKFFSARRASLEEELADAGLTSTAAPALAAAINQAERRAKGEWIGEELTKRWREASRKLGFEPEEIVGAAIEAGETVVPEYQASNRYQRKSLTSVPELLTETTATFSRRELIEASANALVGTTVSVEDAIRAAQEIVSSDRIVELAETRDGPVYSTPEILAAERSLVELVRRAATSRVVAPRRAVVDRLLGEQQLNNEQKDVVRAATNGARLTLVQGGAGTGKSTTLGAVTQAWQSAGYSVLGAAVAWRAANTLATDLGIEARAIDSWLAAVDHSGAPFSRKTCLIVEEGGLQSTPQALRLLQSVEQAGGVTIIVGDENQLRPVGPGHAMRLIRETIGAVEIGTVVRQREAWARQAPTAFASGKARCALDAYAQRNLIQMCQGPRATVEALAERWQEIVDASTNESVLITAKTNAEVRALSAAVRNRLRECGAIVGPDISIEASDASGNRHTLRLAVGDRVRFLVRNDALEVVNGTEARVLSINTGKGGSISIAAEKDGQQFCFSPSDVADAKGRAHLATAYAATIFQAQGMTVDRALVLLSSRFDRHDAYVAASRSREKTEFFINQRAIDKELEQGQPEANELDMDEARIAYLAERLSRLSIKTNAIDLIAAREQERTRYQELVHEL